MKREKWNLFDKNYSNNGTVRIECILKIFSIPFYIAETIDQEKKMKHSKLADRLEEVIQDPSKISVKLKVLNEQYR